MEYLIHIGLGLYDIILMGHMSRGLREAPAQEDGLDGGLPHMHSSCYSQILAVPMDFL